MTRLLAEHCDLKGHPPKLGLVHSPRYDGCKRASVMASHVLCGCEALGVSRFRDLGHHFLKPGDSVHFSVSRVLHFVQSARGHCSVNCTVLYSYFFVFHKMQRISSLAKELQVSQGPCYMELNSGLE